MGVGRRAASGRVAAAGVWLIVSGCGLATSGLDTSERGDGGSLSSPDGAPAPNVDGTAGTGGMDGSTATNNDGASSGSADSASGDTTIDGGVNTEASTSED